ncbi:hypothetical protein BKA70DRAFT_1376330 [Coprinopsis sp. MPI-PUGE-AT-0042]|nr:hypothetical protein BKA70DRAFT_1376330 [Coprinopsis sp. MPI-PUGE-AT-0042]
MLCGNCDTSGSQDENDDEDADSALGLGPRKRPCRTDPLVHHGRHFGRTIQAFCRVQTLIKNGLSRSVELTFGRLEEDQLTPAERREHAIYEELLKLSPGLEKRLCNGSDEDIFHIAELIQKGSAGARADDTKGLKGVILDWITPRGQCLQPPLMRNVKTDRGFYHPQTGELLYYKYYPEDVWKGLFRSALLVSVRFALSSSPTFSRTDLVTDSERFYASRENVQTLLTWWDMQIFPVYNEQNKNPKKGSVLALMKAQREGRERQAIPIAPISGDA